jgi:4-amino-4-deoxy-L-arabinose transferase-like glycosyltransferase
MLLAVGTVPRFVGVELLLGAAAVALIARVFPIPVGRYVAAGREALGNARKAWLADPPVHRAAVVLTLLFAVALRLYHLNQPMRYDEANTYLRYATRPLTVALTDYSFPNQHIFHSILVWATTRILGFAPWVIRLPALVFGVLLVPATYLTGRVLAGRRAALVAAALVAALPWLVLYSTNARGYTIVCLVFLVLILLADVLAAKDAPELWVPFALLIAVGTYTVPIMLFPAGVASLWILVERARRDGVAAAVRLVPRLAGALGLTGILVLAAYVPVVMKSGVAPLVGNRFVTPLTWPEFARSIPASARSLAESMALGIPALVAILLLLAVAVPFLGPRINRGRLLTLAATIATWCLILLIATRRMPPDRVWLFLAPIACIYAGAGAALAIEFGSRTMRANGDVTCAVASLLLAAGIGGNAVRERAVFTSLEAVGFRDARDVAQAVLAEVADSERLVLIPPSGPSLDYYLLTLGGVRLEKLVPSTRTGRMLVVVDREYDQTLEIVKGRRDDVAWEKYERPVLLKEFARAELYEARVRRP